MSWSSRLNSLKTSHRFNNSDIHCRFLLTVLFLWIGENLMKPYVMNRFFNTFVFINLILIYYIFCFVSPVHTFYIYLLEIYFALNIHIELYFDIYYILKVKEKLWNEGRKNNNNNNNNEKMCMKLEVHSKHTPFGINYTSQFIYV